MFYFLSGFREVFPFFNIFRYITFRAGMAAVTTFVLCMILGPIFINKFKEKRIQEKARREDCPGLDQFHEVKEGTPTMGGVFIIGSVLIAVLLWADLSNRYILLTLFACVWLAILGLVDDLIKLFHSKEPKSPDQERRHRDRFIRRIQQFGQRYDSLTRKRRRGLQAKTKFLWQLFLGCLIGSFVYFHPGISTKLDVPFLKSLTVDLGIFYIPLVALIIIGTSNAVNLTDGLDGLAIGCVLIVSLTLGILSYITGHLKFSEYLFIPFVPGAGELTVFCAALLGASLGFLWFNCYPASIFMGDIGSLALGGSLGAIAVFVKKELLLVLFGGVFVVEAISVILQVFCFKIFKRRIFKIAPLHHHFQMSGWKESKIIVRFWIAAIILALLTLTTLKIR
ncbi:MAG: phospho-N-acetylmuramoyl-pentapeptide-transferase [Candidatus Omnitrophota bacterium]